MKIYISKVVAVFIAAALLLTGCGGSGNTSDAADTTPDSTAQSTAQNSTEQQAWKWHKYETPIELTFMAIAGSDQKWRDGTSIENNEFIQWAKDQLGIVWKAKFTSPNNEEAKNKLNILMSSGDMPDCVFGETPQLGTLINTDYLVPLNDLFDKYGSPLLKNRIQACQEAAGNKYFSSYTKDEKYYAMPIDTDIWGRTWYSTFLRKDILDELGKEVPQTLEQFEDVLAAYKAKYPKGVGLLLEKEPVPNGVSQMSPAMQPFGAYPGRWVKGADGKLAYGSIQPQVKQGLATLRDWYEKGYLDKEFITKDFAKSVEAMAAGNMLSMTGDWWYVWYPLPDTMKNVQGAEFVATSLNGPNGKPELIGPNPFNYAVGISATCRYPEAFIYQLNEQVDSAMRNDKGLRAKMKEEFNYDFKYAEEGTQAKVAKNPNDPEEKWEYDVVAPGPYFTKTNIHPKFYPGLQFKGTVDESYVSCLAVAKAFKENSKEALTPEQAGTYAGLESNKTLAALVSEIELTERIKQDVGFTAFLGAPTDTMVEKNAYLLKLENEMFIKIIIGNASLEEFDSFVEKWKKAGGDQITQEVNEWYDKAK